jgi:hypothetical protein
MVRVEIGMMELAVGSWAGRRANRLMAAKRRRMRKINGRDRRDLMKDMIVRIVTIRV